MMDYRGEEKAGRRMEGEREGRGGRNKIVGEGRAVQGLDIIVSGFKANIC